MPPSTKVRWIRPIAASVTGPRTQRPPYRWRRLSGSSRPSRSLTTNHASRSCHSKYPNPSPAVLQPPLSERRRLRQEPVRLNRDGSVSRPTLDLLLHAWWREFLRTASTPKRRWSIFRSTLDRAACAWRRCLSKLRADDGSVVEHLLRAGNSVRIEDVSPPRAQRKASGDCSRIRAARIEARAVSRAGYLRGFDATGFSIRAIRRRDRRARDGPRTPSGTGARVRSPRSELRCLCTRVVDDRRGNLCNDPRRFRAFHALDADQSASTPVASCAGSVWPRASCVLSVRSLLTLT